MNRRGQWGARLGEERGPSGDDDDDDVDDGDDDDDGDDNGDDDDDEDNDDDDEDDNTDDDGEENIPDPTDLIISGDEMLTPEQYYVMFISQNMYGPAR